MDFDSSNDYHENQPCIHYVETLPSVLHEMTWLQHVKHEVCIQITFLEWRNVIFWSFYVQCTDVIESVKKVREIWNQQGITGTVQLVYGIAGQ